jgi:uncharacterized protein (DUF488 family)
MASIMYTVGHSTRSLEELVGVLKTAGVQTLVDVRSFPGSRRHPQFARGSLAHSLPEHGIEYRHERALGGFRRPLADSPNGGWEQAAFRGYADHMDSPEYLAALERLQALGHARPTCVMCAEAQWWRCHRRLIADSLVIRGWRVRHLGLSTPQDHELTPFAVVGPGHTLTYPPLQPGLEL